MAPRNFVIISTLLSLLSNNGFAFISPIPRTGGRLVPQEVVIVPPPPATITTTSSSSSSSSSLRMAMDYNDPIVAEEFAKVQPMDFDEVEKELQSKGIPVPPTMK